MSLTAPVAAANAPEFQGAWRTCQLEGHLVELRPRHQLVSGFVGNLVPPAIRRALSACCASVEGLLAHLEGLQEGE